MLKAQHACTFQHQLAQAAEFLQRCNHREHQLHLLSGEQDRVDLLRKQWFMPHAVPDPAYTEIGICFGRNRRQAVNWLVSSNVQCTDDDRL